MPCSCLDIWRIGKDHIKLIIRMKTAQVSMDEADSILQMIETHISSCQIDQRRLNLNTCDMRKGFDAQKKRDDPTACAELQTFVRAFCLDKISQHGCIDGESVSFFLLKNKDAAVVKGI